MADTERNTLDQINDQVRSGVQTARDAANVARDMKKLNDAAKAARSVKAAETAAQGAKAAATAAKATAEAATGNVVAAAAEVAVNTKVGRMVIAVALGVTLLIPIILGMLPNLAFSALNQLSSDQEIIKQLAEEEAAVSSTNSVEFFFKEFFTETKLTFEHLFGANEELESAIDARDLMAEYDEEAAIVDIKKKISGTRKRFMARADEMETQLNAVPQADAQALCQAQSPDFTWDFSSGMSKVTKSVVKPATFSDGNALLLIAAYSTQTQGESASVKMVDYLNWLGYQDKNLFETFTGIDPPWKGTYMPQPLYEEMIAQKKEVLGNLYYLTSEELEKQAQRSAGAEGVQKFLQSKGLPADAIARVKEIESGYQKYQTALLNYFIIAAEPEVTTWEETRYKTEIRWEWEKQTTVDPFTNTTEETWELVPHEIQVPYVVGCGTVVYKIEYLSTSQMVDMLGFWEKGTGSNCARDNGERAWRVQTVNTAVSTSGLSASADAAGIYTYLRDVMGLNPAAACGVLANIEAESGFRLDAYGDVSLGGSFGLCQWHAGRYERLMNWCAGNGLDYTTADGQLAYLQYELQTYETSTWNKLQTVPNTAQGAYDAGYYWCRLFERPADAENQARKRGNNARSNYWPLYGQTDAKKAQPQQGEIETSTQVRKPQEILTTAQQVMGDLQAVYLPISGSGEAAQVGANQSIPGDRLVDLFIAGAYYNAAANFGLTEDLRADVASMLSGNDQAAANRIIDSVGLEQIQAFIRGLDCNGTNIAGKYGAGMESSTTTLQDCAKVLRLVYQKTLVSEDASSAILEALQRQISGGVLAQNMPEHVTVAALTVQNDAVLADISLMAEDDKAYIIGVYRGNTAGSQELLEALAKDLYDVNHQASEVRSNASSAGLKSVAFSRTFFADHAFYFSDKFGYEDQPDNALTKMKNAVKYGRDSENTLLYQWDANGKTFTRTTAYQDDIYYDLIENTAEYANIVLDVSNGIRVGNGQFNGTDIAKLAEQEFATYGGTACGSRYWPSGPEAWCVDFVYWCADQLGYVGDGNIFGSRISYVSGAAQHLKDAGAEFYWPGDGTVPAAGDIIFFWDTIGRPGTASDGVYPDSKMCHIGIVSEGTNSTVTVIEGNCGSSNPATSVLKKNTYALTGRCWSSSYGDVYIACFAKPRYPAGNFDASDKAGIQTAMLQILYGGASGGGVTCDFDGYQNTPGRHEGIDFARGKGSGVYCLADGQIIAVNRGADGSGSGSLSTVFVYDAKNNKTVVYMHLTPSGSLAVGSTISRGDFLGNEASRGANAVHTHVEVVNGRSTYAMKSVNDPTLDNDDPYPYWAAVLGSSSAKSV